MTEDLTTPLTRSDFTSDAAFDAYRDSLARIIFRAFGDRQIRPSPLEAVKGVLPRSDFESEAEYRKYLNSIRGMIYVEFFSRPVEDFSLARGKQNRRS